MYCTSALVYYYYLVQTTEHSVQYRGTVDKSISLNFTNKLVVQSADCAVN